jgi:hypothetical protein
MEGTHKRYTLTSQRMQPNPAYMRETQDGEWIKYETYLELLTRYNELVELTDSNKR